MSVPIMKSRVVLAVISGVAMLVGPAVFVASARAFSANPPGSTSVGPLVPRAAANPAGDIPDSTKYTARRFPQGGLTISFPDGWSSKATTSSVHFTSTVNFIDVSWRIRLPGQTAAAATAHDVTWLKRSLPDFLLRSIHAVALSGGPAVLSIYETTSAPDSVSGRRYRLVVERFTFVHTTRVLVLSLSSPVGADNVDPWRIISQSVRFTG